jgi:hypothetical protein
MYTARKISAANLKLTDNLIVLPDTASLYRKAVLTDWTAESGSFWIDATIDCLRAVSDGMISV